MSGNRTRGFLHSMTASGKWGRCRYLIPGELERSLLKDRFLYEDARTSSLVQWHGQAPALPVLSLASRACDRRDARAANGAATDHALRGRRDVFGLSADYRAASAAVCAGIATTGSVDASGAVRATNACGGGRDRGGQHRFRKIERAARPRHRIGSRSASDNTGRGCSGTDGQTAVGEGNAVTSAR